MVPVAATSIDDRLTRKILVPFVPLIPIVKKVQASFPIVFYIT